MKTTIKKTLSFLTIFSMAMVYSSCTEDDPVEPGPPGGNGPPTNSNVIDKNINSKTILKDHKSGVDYEICGRIHVNAELIIEAGTEIVMCSGARVYIDQSGSLNAIGTAVAPIIFKGKTASKGYWDMIHIESNNPSNIFNHVILSDGGGYSYYANATVFVNDANGGQLTMKNTQIKNSKGYGIAVQDGASIPDFSNNVFTDNGDAPVRIPFSIIGALDDSSDYADGNTNNYINVLEATLNQAQEVKDINVPYLLNGRNYIKDNLSLLAGVEWLMASGARVYVESTGSFNAVGTAGNPISIEGKVNTNGYWDMIHIESNNPLNEFKHVNIKNGGGYDYYKYASLFLNNDNNASFKMNDCSISDSYSWGLYVQKGAAITPSTEGAIESANTFSNNGNGTSASCTGNCSVHIEQ